MLNLLTVLLEYIDFWYLDTYQTLPIMFMDKFREIITIMIIQCGSVLRHDAGGGLETTLSFGVAL